MAQGSPYAYYLFSILKLNPGLDLKTLKIGGLSREGGGDELRIWARKRFYQQPAVARRVPDISV